MSHLYPKVGMQRCLEVEVSKLRTVAHVDWLFEKIEKNYTLWALNVGAFCFAFWLNRPTVLGDPRTEVGPSAVGPVKG